MNRHKIIKPFAVVVFVAAVSLVTSAQATPPPEDFYVDVRTYLPKNHVTDGSVDYKTYIQKCFDENSQVYFSGSNDQKNPMIYGTTSGLKTRPFTVIQFGANAILKRLPCFGDLIYLGQGTRVQGAVVDGNKYAHWPLVKDRPAEAYAYVIGHVFMMDGDNVLLDCMVYNNAGIAYGSWNGGNNKLFRCRAENCGFVEATESLRWMREYASADGFFFGAGSYNTVKDSEAIDCARWDFTVSGNAGHTTLVDCRGGDVNISSYGFIDIETAGPGNSIVRCRSANSQIVVHPLFQDVIGCQGSVIIADHAAYLRMLGNTVLSGPIRLCEVGNDRLVTPGRQSPMLSYNRVILGGSWQDHSLTVISNDGTGDASYNVLYGYVDGEKRSTPMLLYGVGARTGNLQLWGQWNDILQQPAKSYYVRAKFDAGKFKK